VLQNYYKKKIKQILGSDIIKTYDNFGQFYITINSKNILRIVSILNANSELAFSSLTDYFAADFIQINKTFAIYYQLVSYNLKSSLFITTDILEGEIMQSISLLFENANWFEREIFDMFGIQFNNHPDMRRLLNRPDFPSFPLRKDFVFPNYA
jgi:NADH-quinone oxidoreductase subunit C